MALENISKYVSWLENSSENVWQIFRAGMFYSPTVFKLRALSVVQIVKY